MGDENILWQLLHSIVNVLNDTELRIFKWLVVHFILYELYFNLRKCELSFLLSYSQNFVTVTRKLWVFHSPILNPMVTISCVHISQTRLHYQPAECLPYASPYSLCLLLASLYLKFQIELFLQKTFKKGRMNWESSIDIYTLPCVK